MTEALPGAQFAEWHSRVIEAEPAAVWEAFHTARWSELRSTKVFLYARAGGLAISLDRLLTARPGPGAPIAEEAPHYTTSGMIGRPWWPVPQQLPPADDLDELRAFDRPGWLKYGMEWVFSSLPGGRTFVETATVCEATDRIAERRFRAYWALIRPFSGLLRHDLLSLLERRATSV